MMITPQIPINDPHTNLNIPAIQRLLTSEVTDMLQGNDSSDFIRKLVLGYYVGKTIHENEAKHVTTSVHIVDLQTNRSLVSHNENEQHFAASINKLPVVLLVLQDLRASKLSLEQMMTWSAADVRAGFGLYDQPGALTQAKLGDVIFDMLHRSGNTAVRILVNQGLGGAAAVNQRWSGIPELSNTRLQPLDANRFYLGNSTVHDSLWAMTQLMKKQDSHAQFMKEAMRTNIFSDVGTRSQLAGNPYITLVNKVGLLDDAEGNNRHDAGIIYNMLTKKSYAYSFFTTSPFEDVEATPQAEQSLKDMGRYTLRYSGDKKQREAGALSVENAREREKRVLY